MSLEPTQSLKIWEGNARKHSKKQVRKIAESIKSFGFTAPLLIDEDGAILAGHGRYAAAKLLGLDLVPCITLGHLTHQQKRAYVIADNRLSDESVWDYGILAQELSAIKISDPDLDLSLTGFSLPEIEIVLTKEERRHERKLERKQEKTQAREENGLKRIANQTPQDDCLPQLSGPLRAQKGDIWQIGCHRIICDEPSSDIAINRLMESSKASLVISDITIPDDSFEYKKSDSTVTYYEALFQNFSNASHEKAIHLLFSQWKQWLNITEAAQSVYGDHGMPRDVIIWDKGTSNQGSLYKSGHGIVFAFQKAQNGQDKSKIFFSDRPLQRSNVWSYQKLEKPLTLQYENDEYEADQRPVIMLCHAIEDLSQDGDIILDGFGWTGTSLIAAQKTGRRAFVCEEDPVLFETILRRAEAFLCDEAKLVSRLSNSNKGATS